MSEPTPTPSLPGWLSRTLVVLLVVQVALLWTHGSMLQRQHDDLEALRGDVQALADSLDQDQDGWDADGGDQDASPVRRAVPRPSRVRPGSVRAFRRHGLRPGRPALLRVQDPAKAPADPEEQQPAKELDASRKSAQEAVAKARQVQGQLSITENIRKADERAALEGAGSRWLPWLAFGGAAAVLALLGRAWFRRRS